MTHQVLFVQGGGAGAHDEWDNKLVDSLTHALGGGYEVRYPQMPDEDSPDFARWSKAIASEVKGLDDGAILVGHSIGAAILINALAAQPPERRLSGIFLVAAPFVGEGGWPPDGFEPVDHLGAALPDGVPIHLYHGQNDETAPVGHLGLYRRAIPQAITRRFIGRDHQFNNDLSEVAADIRALG